MLWLHDYNYLIYDGQKKYGCKNIIWEIRKNMIVKNIGRMQTASWLNCKYIPLKIWIKYVCIFLVLTKSMSETRLNQTVILCKNESVTKNFLP